MRKFIITSNTSDGYQGEVQVVYDEQMVLMLLDFSHATIKPETIDWITGRCPAVFTMEGFQHAYGNPKLTVVEGSYEITLEMFWQKYNKKVNLKRFTPLWTKASQTKRARAYHGIAPYDAFLTRNSWRSKADPVTYFKDEYWQNDWSKM